jgi:hypothetical protein
MPTHGECALRNTSFFPRAIGGKYEEAVKSTSTPLDAKVISPVRGAKHKEPFHEFGITS